VNEFVPHVWLALGLDLLVGDPRWFPHPVRLIGRLAQSLETPARKIIRQPRLAGIAVAGSVIGATGGSPAGVWPLMSICIRPVMPGR
jgi:adenosylcobinamide-phosphate synthase